MLLHTAVYAGVPAANAAFAIAQQVLAEMSSGAFVQSLERGLAVIRALSTPEPQTQSDVARATGLSRAAVRRFLLTLEHLGYVRATDGRFALTPRVLELGYAYLSGLTLPEVARPHLERLVEEVHESSSVSVLDGDDIVYVARVPTRRIMSVAISVGTRFPAYATSMGRVLLAGLPAERARRRLAARDAARADAADHRSRERAARRARAVARAGLRARRPGARGRPALDRGPDPRRRGHVVAAVNLSAHASPHDARRHAARLLPPLRHTAAGDRARSGRSPLTTVRSSPPSAHASCVSVHDRGDQRHTEASGPDDRAMTAETRHDVEADERLALARAAANSVPTDVLIGGTWSEPAGGVRFAVDDPATGETIAVVADAGARDGLAALDAAVGAAREWAGAAPDFRSAVLARICSELRRQTTELAALLTFENASRCTRRSGEVAYAADYFAWYAEEARRSPVSTTLRAGPGNADVLTLRAPVGPCLLITPWNFPRRCRHASSPLRSRQDAPLSSSRRS